MGQNSDEKHEKISQDDAGSRGTVLVVDDEPGFCRIVSDILQAKGFIVLEANSVPQALLQLESVIPNLLLVDVMMPQIDGLQLVEQLANDPKWLNTKIVVTSAKVEASNRMASWERGADAFLPKPFQAKELLDVIDYVLS